VDRNEIPRDRFDHVEARRRRVDIYTGRTAMARKSKRNNRTIRSRKSNKTASTIRRRATRIFGPIEAAKRKPIDWLNPVNYEVIESVAVAPSTTVREQERKTPRQKEWSTEKLRVRCKDKPRNNKPKGAGSGRKDFIPWC
jgi:hypothetical protein